jgi:hypothetical protein
MTTSKEKAKMLEILTKMQATIEPIMAKEEKDAERAQEADTNEQTISCLNGLCANLGEIWHGLDNAIDYINCIDEF